MKFSDNLRNLRLQRQLTQMQLAEDLRTSQSAITSWENGKREPDFKTIERIAKYFNVPLSALLPSSDNLDDAYVTSIAEAFQQNPYLKLLFDRLRFKQSIYCLCGIGCTAPHRCFFIEHKPFYKTVNFLAIRVNFKQGT